MWNSDGRTRGHLHHDTAFFLIAIAVHRILDGDDSRKEIAASLLPVFICSPACLACGVYFFFVLSSR